VTCSSSAGQTRLDEEERASLAGLGLAVSKLRKDLNMSRQALMQKEGLTGNTITRIESGIEKELKWGILRHLAQGLDVPVEDLVKLAIELAPGPAGEQLRANERGHGGV
jgi:transcriptional regulator with XRE-family HTH domain